MPLIKSSSKSAREENIREMIDSGHSVEQSVAASYSNQRRSKRKHKRSSKRR